MKRRKVLFIQLSQIRLLAKKFAIVILFLSAFVMMLINKTDTVIIEKTSSMATDVVSPLIDVLVVPARTLAGVFDYFRDLSKIYDDNRKLRAENNRLQIVSDKARALEIENKLLAKLLNYTPPPNAKFVTARVIAEEGDAFSHSIIAYTGRDSGVEKGQVVMSDNGVIGRVDKPGKMYSKIILITDINSKIPVMVERTRVRGILSGDNTTVPKMIFIPLSAKLTVGDRIITPQQIAQALGRVPTPEEMKMLLAPKKKKGEKGKVGIDMMSLLRDDGKEFGTWDALHQEGISIKQILEAGKKIFRRDAKRPPVKDSKILEEVKSAQQKAADENKAALRRQIEEHKRQELENRRSKKLELEQEVRREAAGKEERREEKAERPIDVRILSRGGNER